MKTDKICNFVFSDLFRTKKCLVLYKVFQLLPVIHPRAINYLFTSAAQYFLKDYSVSIIIHDNYQNLYRDLLLTLNSISSRKDDIPSSRNGYYQINKPGKSRELFLYLKDESIDWVEIVSCLHLTNVRYTSHITGFAFDNIIFNDGTKDFPSLVIELGLGKNNSYMEGLIPGYGLATSDSSFSNTLDVPFSYRASTHIFQKMKSPETKYVSIEIPLEPDSGPDSLEKWRHFFIRMMNDYPMIHFVLLNPLSAFSDMSQINLPNVTLTKQQGFSLLDELSLVRESDYYIGNFSVYSVMVLGTDIPYIIQESGKKQQKEHRNGSSAQIWISPESDTEQFFDLIEGQLQGHLWRKQ